MTDPVILDVLDGVRRPQFFENLHLISKWNQPGTEGDTGGGNKLAHGTSEWTPGNPSVMKITPARRLVGQPWDTFFCNNTLTLDPKLPPPNYLGYGLDFCLPAALDITNTNAFEWEIELCELGTRYNMGWQYRMTGVRGWYHFNKLTETWGDRVQGLPDVEPVPGKFVSVLGHFKINRENRTVEHDSIVIDGKFFPLRTVFPAAPLPGNSKANHLKNAIQLDSNGKGGIWSVQLNKMVVRVL